MKRLLFVVVLICAVAVTPLRVSAQTQSHNVAQISSNDDVKADYEVSRRALNEIIATRGLQEVVDGKPYIGYMTWDKWIVIIPQEKNDEDEENASRYLSYSGATGDTKFRIAAYLNPANINSQFGMLESERVEYSYIQNGYIPFYFYYVLFDAAHNVHLELSSYTMQPTRQHYKKSIDLPLSNKQHRAIWKMMRLME